MSDTEHPSPRSPDEHAISLTWDEGLILDSALGLGGLSDANRQRHGFTRAEFDEKLKAVQSKVWCMLDAMAAEHRAAKAASENPSEAKAQ